MKVLVVGPDRSDPGGVANYYNAVFPRLSVEDVEAHYLEIGSTRGDGTGLHILGDQLRLWRTIGNLQPDVVHLNPSLVPRSFFRDGLFALQAKLHRRKLLVFFRGWDTSFERRVKGPLGWFFNNSLGTADMFIVLASCFASRLREWGVKAPILLGSTVVNDDDLAGFSLEDKQQAMRSSDRLKLLFLARLEWGKGVVDLVDAVIILLDRGYRLMLTIAGDGPAMKEVKSRVAKNSLYGEFIRIAGYVRGEKKTEIFRTHHIFCMPTRYAEGMPNSIIEAMGFGMPVITCPVGGIADFFEDGRMGVLVPDRNVAMIAGAIEELVSDTVRMAEIAHNNHEYATGR